MTSSTNTNNAVIIDADLISYLEDLSCLELTDNEKHRLSGDLNDILRKMAQLSELDTENVLERSHPFDNVNAFREDELQGSLDRELILKNAPHSDEETFIVPKTIA